MTSSRPEPGHPELLVAVPAYNEQDAIASVVRTWQEALARLTPDFVMVVIDDGSTDRTAAILEGLQPAFGARLEIIRQENRGHGQTCLAAYRLAVARGIPWILQIDSDGQCDPEDFPSFWTRRESFDVLAGARAGRQDGWRRVLASRILQMVLLVAARTWCVDANVPYRLMRTDRIADKVTRIPADFSLANIALSVLVARDRSLRQVHLPIRFHPRCGGEPSVPLSRFLAKAVELVTQLRTLR